MRAPLLHRPFARPLQRHFPQRHTLVLTENELLAIAHALEPRLRDLEHDGYQELFEGEAAALRRCADLIEAKRRQQR